MKFLSFIFTQSFLFVFGMACLSCSPVKYEKKKIVYINSYHRGHPSSDEIMDAILDYFPSDSFAICSYFMDTKRNPSLEYIQNISTQLYDSIVAINPDILIVSDDNAVKYIVQPHIEVLSIPVVFCGVNGSDREYNLPHNKVTGMIEVLPVAETLTTLRPYYPSMGKLLVLNENTTTSRKEKALLDTMFTRVGVSATYALVDDFDTWKTTFKKANLLYDIIYIVTHGAIKGWDHEEAVQLIHEHIQVPVITCEDFMMPYAVFGLTKVASEQGQWAAKTAKQILGGKSPVDFPVTRNQLYTTWLNVDLAERIDFQPDTTKFVNFHLVE